MLKYETIVIKRALKRVLYLILPVVIGFSTYTGLVATPTATAQNTDWISAELYPIVTPGADLSKFDQNNFCSSPKVEVGGNMVQACGHNTKVPYSEITLPEDNDSGSLLGVNIDGAWQPVRTGFDRAYSVGNTGDLIGKRSNSGASEFLYYKNFMSRLVPADSIDGVEKYKLYGSPDFTLKLSGIDKVNVAAIAPSQNSEWLAMYVSNVGVLRMNTETLKMELVAPKIDPEYSMTAHHLAISNSGKYIVDNNMAPTIGRVYKLEPSCTREIDEHTDLSQFTIPCAYQILPSSQPSSSSPGLYYTYTYFTPDDSEIYSYSIYGNTINVREYIPQPPEPTPEPEVEHKLDYLALGDSYTSGEGDIREGFWYYMPNTDSEKGCHLSYRSYPYLLARIYDMEYTRMKSVACSGAQVNRDYMGNSTNYMGQSSQLNGKSEGYVSKARKEALENFTPGIIKQLDFVKEYKPKIVTIMGGGNDLGFADILRYCANFAFPLIPYTCDYAKSDTELSKMLKNQIKNQYNINKVLINQIKTASPNTQIIIVGYPSFIATDTNVNGLINTCGVEAASLNKDERKMINNAVSSFNNILKKLAHDTSVQFADLEGSLAGGRLCEGSAYVNGSNAVGGIQNLPNDPAAFHPNDMGHMKMSVDIYDQDVFNDSVITSHEYDNVDINNTENVSRGNGIKINDKTLTIKIEPGTFMPFSKVTVTIHSVSTDLGQYTVGADGGLEATIDINTIEDGNHVVVVSGVDSNTKPTKVFNFVNKLPQNSVQYATAVPAYLGNISLAKSYTLTVADQQEANSTQATDNKSNSQNESIHMLTKPQYSYATLIIVFLVFTVLVYSLYRKVIINKHE